MMWHPNDDELERFLRDDEDQTTEHLLWCRECRQRLKQIEQEIAAIRAALGTEANNVVPISTGNRLVLGKFPPPKAVVRRS